MSFIIDRFEGETAVIETDGGIYNIPKAILPEDAKEGDVIAVVIDRHKTDEKKQEVKKLIDSLFDETE